jgi:hypothetical protein
MKNEVKTRRAGILYRKYNIRICNVGGYNYKLYMPVESKSYNHKYNTFYPNGQYVCWKPIPGTFRMKEIPWFIKSLIRRKLYASQAT